MQLTLAEMSAEALRPPPSRRLRRRAKFVRFLLCETAALAAMLVSARLSVAEHFLDRSYNHLFATLMIVTASAVAIIPVLFYGVANRLSRRLR